MPESVPELLRKELAGLRRFCGLIEEERKILIGAQADRLPDIASEKFSLATELSRLEARRDELLAQAGFGKGRPAIQAWFASHGSASPERRQWDELIKLAAQAREGNETNGRLIKTLLKQNQEALSALLSGGADTIYGADGQQSHSLAGKRSLGTG